MSKYIEHIFAEAKALIIGLIGWLDIKVVLVIILGYINYIVNNAWNIFKKRWIEICEKAGFAYKYPEQYKL